VHGVVTGLSATRTPKVVVADDDVRYDAPTFRRVVGLLDRADVVIPQNHFDPLPWHARWDTARILLNRAVGFDWPGTLAVRRAALDPSDGYDGDVLFENLELVRTVRANGGGVLVAGDCHVPRRPPTTRHFWSQRVRQAYDELARPPRLVAGLAVVPVTTVLTHRRPRHALPILVAPMALAAWGRHRHGGARVFPRSSVVLAPLWVLERAICSWVALVWRCRGGCPYAGERIPRAAHSMRALRRSSHRPPAPRARSSRARTGA
jgi:hypothetical protein